MIVSIKDNGKKIFDRGMEYLFGKMVPDMRVIGSMIVLTAKDAFSITKVIIIKVNF